MKSGETEALVLTRSRLSLLPRWFLVGFGQYKRHRRLLGPQYAQIRLLPYRRAPPTSTRRSLLPLKANGRDPVGMRRAR